MKSPSRTLQNAVLLYSIGFIITAIFFIVHFSSREHIHSTYHLVTQDYVYSSRCSSPYPLSYTNRLYKPLKEYNKVQLIFYRKMKMSLAVEVCQNNGWILSKTIHSRQELQSQLDNQNVFSIVFTSSKELSNRHMNSLLNQTNVLVSAIPNAYLFTGAKREQYITFQRYLNRHKCSINELKFMPVSFLMDSVKECEGFYKYMRLNRDSAVWVLKKSQGYGGDGVTVMSNRTAIKLVFDTCPSRQQYIMQEYLQDMLLLNGRKFDIRALFLIANTKPYMLFYHDGYLRVVMSQFYETGGREVHLTNTHVQSMQPNFSPNDHFWSFKKLQSHLDVHYPDNEQYVQSYLIPYIKKVGIFIVKAGTIMDTMSIMLSFFHLRERINEWWDT